MAPGGRVDVIQLEEWWWWVDVVGGEEPSEVEQRWSLPWGRCHPPVGEVDSGLTAFAQRAAQIEMDSFFWALVFAPTSRETIPT